MPADIFVVGLEIGGLPVKTDDYLTKLPMKTTNYVDCMERRFGSRAIAFVQRALESAGC